MQKSLFETPQLNDPLNPPLQQCSVSGSTDKKARQLADKWIKELQEIGCTPDEMLYIFREARKKFEQLKK